MAVIHCSKRGQSRVASGKGQARARGQKLPGASPRTAAQGEPSGASRAGGTGPGEARCGSGATSPKVAGRDVKAHRLTNCSCHGCS